MLCDCRQRGVVSGNQHVEPAHLNEGTERLDKLVRCLVIVRQPMKIVNGSRVQTWFFGDEGSYFHRNSDTAKAPGDGHTDSWCGAEDQHWSMEGRSAHAMSRHLDILLVGSHQLAANHLLGFRLRPRRQRG